MRRLMAVALAVSALSLVACGAREVQLVAPAPGHRTALDCALNEANARGYLPGARGVDAGHLTVDRKVGGGTGEEVLTRLMTFGLAGANSVDLDRLVIVGAEGICESPPGPSERLARPTAPERKRWRTPGRSW